VQFCSGQQQRQHRLQQLLAMHCAGKYAPDNMLLLLLLLLQLLAAWAWCVLLLLLFLLLLLLWKVSGKLLLASCGQVLLLLLGSLAPDGLLLRRKQQHGELLNH
jgi:hypothetical protein